MNYIEGQKLRM